MTGCVSTGLWSLRLQVYGGQPGPFLEGGQSAPTGVHPFLPMPHKILSLARFSRPFFPLLSSGVSRLSWLSLGPYTVAGEESSGVLPLPPGVRGRAEWTDGGRTSRPPCCYNCFFYDSQTLRVPESPILSCNCTVHDVGRTDPRTPLTRLWVILPGNTNPCSSLTVPTQLQGRSTDGPSGRRECGSREGSSDKNHRDGDAVKPV